MHSGTKILPKLKSGNDLKVGIDFATVMSAEAGKSVEAEIRQLLAELGVGEKVSVQLESD